MTLEDFNRIVEKWKKLAENGKKEEADKIYQEQIFPEVKKIVKAKIQKEEMDYYGLILLVGFSPEPLILSKSALEPECVYLLYSRETRSLLDNIVSETGLKPSEYSADLVESSDASDIYERIKNKWIEWGKKKNIAVDITGGKKSMVGGASMAGALLGFDLLYVDYDKYIPSLRKPEPGSEIIVKLRNPYDVFGDLQKEKAIELFNKHNYQRSKELFEELKEKVNDPRPYEILFKLALGYEQWNRFEYAGAKSNLESALRMAERFQVYDLDIANLKKNLKVVDILKENRNKSLFELLKNEEFALHLMVDIYCSAEREAKQGHYDDGIIRLYRVLELISQYYLAKHNLDTKNVDKQLLPINVQNEFKELTKQIYGGAREIPTKIALMDGYILLAALNEIKKSELKNLYNAIQPRNLLMIEHGNNLGDSKIYNKFKRTVWNYLEKTVGEKLNTYINEHVHITLR
ncbi:MAG: TIGR02710 family CRISPR-associated CARF protein [Methanosarcinales archaeon]